MYAFRWCRCGTAIRAGLFRTLSLQGRIEDAAAKADPKALLVTSENCERSTSYRTPTSIIDSIAEHLTASKTKFLATLLISASRELADVTYCNTYTALYGTRLSEDSSIRFRPRVN